MYKSIALFVFCLSIGALASQVKDLKLLDVSLKMSNQEMQLAKKSGNYYLTVIGHSKDSAGESRKSFKGWYNIESNKGKYPKLNLRQDSLSIYATGELPAVCSKHLFPFTVDVMMGYSDSESEYTKKAEFKITRESLSLKALKNGQWEDESDPEIKITSEDGNASLLIKVNKFCLAEELLPEGLEESEHCEPQDSEEHGHYTCTKLGRKQCLEGYMDASKNCLVGWSRLCWSNKCGNHGHCVNIWDAVAWTYRYHCHCTVNYYGRHCELAIPEKWRQ